MKKQIKRLSPHQNGKVFAVLSFVGSLLFFLPWIFMMQLWVPANMQGEHAFPTTMMFVFPVIYLVLGYISVALSCLIYNFISKYIGGFEFEVKEHNQ